MASSPRSVMCMAMVAPKGLSLFSENSVDQQNTYTHTSLTRTYYSLECNWLWVGCLAFSCILWISVHFEECPGSVWLVFLACFNTNLWHAQTINFPYTLPRNVQSEAKSTVPSTKQFQYLNTGWTLHRVMLS